MSYDLIVLSGPVPESDSALWDSLHDFSDALGSGEPSKVMRALHTSLTTAFPCPSTLSDDEDGVWSVGPLIDCFGELSAHLPMSYSAAEKVVPVVVDLARSLGLFVLDPQSNLVFRPSGIPGLSLQVEGRPPLSEPTMDQVLGACDALSPDGGPGFLILDRVDGSYVQVAGGNNAYMAEWREQSASTFRHFAAGRPEEVASHRVQIPTNGLHVTIWNNEKLDLVRVKTIASAFAQGLPLPAGLVWRDMTDEFNTR